MATMTATGSGDHEPVRVTFEAAAKGFDELAKQAARLSDQVAEAEGAMTFEQKVRQLAQERPGLSLTAALDLIDRGGHAMGLTGVTMRERAEWILSQQDIVDLMVNRKINAIKEVRARTYLGLKEAKEAVEYAQELKNNGWLSPAEKQKLEEESRAAIASILGAPAGEPVPSDAQAGGPVDDLRTAQGDGGVPRSGTCPRCGHRAHEANACYNLASDNDCDCPGV